MIVKTFTGANVRDVLAQVRESFGPDAVILDTTFDRNIDGRPGRSGAGVSVTAAFDADLPEESPREGHKTLHVTGALSEVPATVAPPVESTEATEVTESSDDAPAAEAPMDHGEPNLLASAIRRLHADVMAERSAVAGTGIWPRLKSWLATEPQLTSSIAEAYATHVAESLPPTDRFLDHRLKGQTVLVVGSRGSGKSTALFKCLTARWQAQERKPQLLVLSGTDDHGQERMQKWCERCDVTFNVHVAGEKPHLRSLRRDRGEDLFVEFVPPAYAVSCEAIARKIVSTLQPDVVVQVLSGTGSPEAWKSEIRRFAHFSPTHLVISHWDEQQAWWRVGTVAKDIGLALAYRTEGSEPYAEIEPFTTTDLRTAFAEHVAREIDGKPSACSGQGGQS